MLHRIRLEVTVAAALAIAIAALVLALRSGDPGTAPAVVAEEPAVAVEASVAAKVVPKGAAEVDIVDFAYSPEPVRVRVGESIGWTNFDTTPHTVTSSVDGWDSGVLDKGQTFAMTFDEPGTYVYICTLHPPRRGIGFAAPEGTKLIGGGGGVGMQGTIIVE